MDDEYYYYNAKNRYYNACSEINSYQNTINDLKAQRQNQINRINQLEVDIRNTQIALDGMTQIVKSDERLKQKIVVIDNKTNQAAMNFSSMVYSSSIQSKSLMNVYSSETSKTMLDNIFNTLETQKKNLENKLNDLRNQLNYANFNLNDLNNQIQSAQRDLQYWNDAKRSASYDMEYYRRKMREVF